MTETIIDPSLQNSLAELMGGSLNSDQIDRIGQLMLKDFDSHALLGVDHHITLSSRRSAELLIEKCIQKGFEEKLFKFLIETDPGKIVSETINYAAHMEKYYAKPGCVAVSDAILSALPKSMRNLSIVSGDFEERTSHMLYCKDPEDQK